MEIKDSEPFDSPSKSLHLGIYELNNSLMDLQEVLERIRQNDPVTIGKIYKNVMKSGIGYIVKRDGTTEEAREVVQDAMWRFYEKVRTDKCYTLQSPPEGAIFGFIKNIWRERIRNRKDQQDKISLDEDTYRSETLATSAPTIIEELTLPPKNPVFPLLDRLGEGCKEILIAFYVHKVRLTELAVELGSSNGYLKVKKHRCMEQLRALYIAAK